MKAAISVIVFLVTTSVLIACAPSKVRQGQRIFAGCPEGVDDSATLESGLFICDGQKDPAPFDGNGRACGDCHVPGDNFGLSQSTIASLPDDHPLFFPGLGDDPRDSGKILVVVADAGMTLTADDVSISEFRQTPKLVHLAELCDKNGDCDALGLLGDRTRDLCDFSRQAVQNHSSKTAARVPGADFRIPTDDECDALVAYMLSELVSGQDERNAR